MPTDTPGANRPNVLATWVGLFARSDALAMRLAARWPRVRTAPAAVRTFGPPKPARSAASCTALRVSPRSADLLMLGFARSNAERALRLACRRATASATSTDEEAPASAVDAAYAPEPTASRTLSPLLL